MPGKIFHMKNRGELANFVKVNDYVIIKIGAEWCGPCKRIQPTVDKLFQQMPNDVHLVMVDADDGDGVDGDDGDAARSTPGTARGTASSGSQGARRRAAGSASPR